MGDPLTKSNRRQECGRSVERGPWLGLGQSNAWLELGYSRVWCTGELSLRPGRRKNEDQGQDHPFHLVHREVLR